MRRFVFAILSLSALPGCVLKDAEAPLVVRVAGEPATVVGVAVTAAGLTQLVEQPCRDQRCLATRDDGVAIVLPSGEVWAWLGDVATGAVLPKEPQQGEPEGVSWARTILARPEPQPQTTATPPPPELPPTLRTCGTTGAGGGFGYHIIRNAGDVWQRIHWVTPPTDAQTAALPVDVYPIAGPGGALCAWGEQRVGERRWTIHHASSPTTVAAIVDREHAPARCAVDGGVEVSVEGGSIRIEPDGTTRPLQLTIEQGPSHFNLLSDGGRITAAMESGVLSIVRDGVRVAEVAFLPAKMLDGTPFPAGLRRDRVLGQGNGAGMFAFVERLISDDGRGHERLTFVRLDGAKPVVINSTGDDKVITRLSSARGGFFWIEAPATVMRLAEP